MSRKYVRAVVSAVLWTATLLWMCFIFGMSAENSENSGETSGKVADTVASIFVSGYDDMTDAEKAEVLSGMSHPLRKTAHFSEYAVLGVLSFCAISVTAGTKIKKRTVFVITVAFCFAYACSDEAHQYFVPGRAASFVDVMIDTSGATLGASVLCLLYKPLLIRPFAPSA